MSIHSHCQVMALIIVKNSNNNNNNKILNSIYTHKFGVDSSSPLGIINIKNIDYLEGFSKSVLASKSVISKQESLITFGTNLRQIFTDNPSDFPLFIPMLWPPYGVFPLTLGVWV